MKMFTKVIRKKMTLSVFLHDEWHSKLDLFTREKWKTFISFVGKVVNIFLLKFFRSSLEFAQGCISCLTLTD
jgi:hypothetical protein